MALNLFTVPPHVPFLDALAQGWLARGEDPLALSRGLILLPTRRSARALAEAFLRAGNGRPMLLPRITALGALDETPLALTGALDLPPAVAPMQRLAVLSTLILAMKGDSWRAAHRRPRLASGPRTGVADGRSGTRGIDLAARLPDAADPEYAAHWAQTLKFLHIVTDIWPDWLAENGVMNPAARQVALLQAQARAWDDDPPDDPVLIAGTTAGIPAVARLLGVVARMRNGQVVLPQLDLGMDEEAWRELEASHAQAGLARLLTDLNATRGDVREWLGGGAGAVPRDRFGLLSRALLPASALDDWMAPWPRCRRRVVATDGGRPAARSAGHCLVLRDALETPGARAALVTPDRNLAGRVAAALLRFGIVADDSAGEPLAESPPAVFLRLLVRAVAEELAPVPLLALLKHPLCGSGHESDCLPAGGPDTRDAVSAWPSPDARHKRVAADCGQGSGTSLFDGRVSCRAWKRVWNRLCDLTRRWRSPRPRRLAPWSKPRSGWPPQTTQVAPRGYGRQRKARPLATRLAEMHDAWATMPDLRRGVLPGLLDAILEGEVVRSRRALRGRGGVEHPRIFIWGLLEARLQSADLIVLGGLAETVWPPMVEPGPWLSRPMRTKVGLPAPEEAVGQAAHDFLAACCSAPTVVLSCPVRRDNAPAVPARWLTRLDMFLAGRGGDGEDMDRTAHGRKTATGRGATALPEHPAVAWARAMDLPDGQPSPVKPPSPRPPVNKRPRQLSVTAIETWLRDPYAIHARHILKLAALKPLDEATDASDYGSIVHDGLHRFLRTHGAAWSDDAARALRVAMSQALGDAGLRQALIAWWSPRLERIADWVAGQETERRFIRAPLAIATEANGVLDLHRPGGRFRLTGRADRIERYDDGTLAILDYKTGSPPTQKAVDDGLAPQLLLEAAIAAEGGFGSELRGSGPQG